MRAVVDVVPESLSFSLTTRSAGRLVEPVLSKDGPLEGLAAIDSVGAELEDEFDEVVGSAQFPEPVEGDFLDLASAFGTGTTQLNPALGPVDLGWPLLVDLGAGETPYDLSLIHI